MATGYYTAAEAARIAKVPRSTVDYWAKTSLVFPSGRKKRPRLYTFQDLRDLVVAQQLRDQGARVQDFRAALQYVRSIDYVERLAQANFWVSDGQLLYKPKGDLVAPHRHGQRVFEISMPKVFQQLGASLASPTVLRPFERVLIDPNVRGGTPVIEGTRIPTRLIRELSEDGLDAQEVIDLYPRLTVADVEAALEWERGQGQRVDAA